LGRVNAVAVVCVLLFFVCCSNIALAAGWFNTIFHPRFILCKVFDCYSTVTATSSLYHPMWLHSICEKTTSPPRVIQPCAHACVPKEKPAVQPKCCYRCERLYASLVRPVAGAGAAT
jgi:hypothetical protein